MGVILGLIVLITMYTILEPFSGFGEGTINKETTRYAGPADSKEITAIEETVEHQNPRTLWDWLGLIGVSAAIGAVGLYFTNQQRQREEAAAEAREQDEALGAYLDRMSDLMLEHDLSDQHETSARKVASSRTIAVLLALDANHKRRPLKLLYELSLIDKSNPLLTLNNASLDNADLSQLALPSGCLSRVDLRATNLSGSNLRGCDLQGADLRGAELTNADLREADLTDANLLPYDEQNPAKLSIHNLEDKEGIPSDSELRGTTSLRLTKVTNVNLEGAVLIGTILGNVDLREVRGLKQDQIEQAIGNRATQLKDGLRLPDKWKYESIEYQIAENKRKGSPRSISLKRYLSYLAIYWAFRAVSRALSKR